MLALLVVYVHCSCLLALFLSLLVPGLIPMLVLVVVAPAAMVVDQTAHSALRVNWCGVRGACICLGPLTVRCKAHIVTCALCVSGGTTW